MTTWMNNTRMDKYKELKQEFSKRFIKLETQNTELHSKIDTLSESLHSKERLRDRRDKSEPLRNWMVTIATVVTALVYVVTELINTYINLAGN